MERQRMLNSRPQPLTDELGLETSRWTLVPN